MTDEPRVIVPAAEDFATIAARLREIEAEKERAREERPVDYGCFDGA